MEKNIKTSCMGGWVRIVMDLILIAFSEVCGIMVQVGIATNAPFVASSKLESPIFLLATTLVESQVEVVMPKIFSFLLHILGCGCKEDDPDADSQLQN